MAQRTLLLDVDATLILDVVDPVLDYASQKGGTGDYEQTAVPAGARELRVTDPLGHERDVFALEDTLLALRQVSLAQVDVVWHSRWLATPARLLELSDALDLTEAVRFPPAASRDEIPPTMDWRLAGTDSDWRMREVVARASTLEEGDDLVMASIDFDLSSNRTVERVRLLSGNPEALLGSIPTHRTSGLDAASLRDWRPERPHVGSWHRRSDRS